MPIVRMRKTCKPPKEILHLVVIGAVLAGIIVLSTIIGPTVFAWIIAAVIVIGNILGTMGSFIVNGFSFVFGFVADLITKNVMFIAFACLFVLFFVTGWAMEPPFVNDTYSIRAIRLGIFWGFGTALMLFARAVSNIRDITSIAILISIIGGSTSGWLIRWCSRCLIFGDKPDDPPFLFPSSPSDIPSPETVPINTELYNGVDEDAQTQHMSPYSLEIPYGGILPPAQIAPEGSELVEENL